MSSKPNPINRACNHCASARSSTIHVIEGNEIVVTDNGEETINALSKLAQRLFSKTANAAEVSCKLLFCTRASEMLYEATAKDGDQTKTFRIRVNDNCAALSPLSTQLEQMKALHRLDMAPHPFMLLNNAYAYESVKGDTGNFSLMAGEEVSKLIAIELARVHWAANAQSFKSIDQEMFVCKALRMFSDMVATQYGGNSKQERFNSVFGSPAALRVEVNEILADIRGLKAPTAFCHNDLLMANVIYQREAKRARFIDWEYAAPNYAAFDIANHFVEFAGFENADFERYPSREFQERFIRVYLNERNRLQREAGARGVKSGEEERKKIDDDSGGENGARDREGKARRDGKEAEGSVSDGEVEDWYIQVQHFSVATLLMWVLWALVQTHFSNLSVDFMSYAVCRYNAYKKVKKERLQL